MSRGCRKRGVGVTAPRPAAFPAQLAAPSLIATCLPAGCVSDPECPSQPATNLVRRGGGGEAAGWPGRGCLPGFQCSFCPLLPAVSLPSPRPCAADGGRWPVAPAGSDHAAAGGWQGSRGWPGPPVRGMATGISFAVPVRPIPAAADTHCMPARPLAQSSLHRCYALPPPQGGKGFQLYVDGQLAAQAAGRLYTGAARLLPGERPRRRPVRAAPRSGARARLPPAHRCLPTHAWLALPCPGADADGFQKAPTGGAPMNLTGNITLCARSDLDPTVGSGGWHGRHQGWGQRIHCEIRCRRACSRIIS